MALQRDSGEPSNQLMRRPPAGQVSYQSGFADDEDAKLERRALEAKNAAVRARKSIPPFVQKLSSFLDESRNTDLIRWSDSGDSFVVLDEDEFARTLIPELFKHNNYASFVRQLNMYGFHKRVGLSDNSMRASERKNKTPSEYSNPYFKRGRPLLLWLIQKPKTTTTKAKGAKARNEDEEEIEEPFEGDTQPNTGEEPSNMRGQRQPLLIDQGDRSLKPNELQLLNDQLRQIRQQQTMITNMLAKIRQEHEQLYQQAAAFTEQHTRHENSINAILTFLATVYNRSLEGQTNQNMANMFAGAIPHDIQQQGNVVDVGDFDTQGVNVPGLPRRLSKRQLLLHAPPGADQLNQARGGNLNSSSRSNAGVAPQFRPVGSHTTYSPATGQIEEIYDQDTPTSNNNARTPATDSSGQDFMTLIHSANARDANTPKGSMDFPQALSHLQNADGKSPLSPQQRDDVLQMIANSSSNGANGSNNALVSPNPPNLPNLDNWNATEQDLQYLERSLKEQNAKVSKLAGLLEPLSPSGTIPGVNDNNYTPPPEGLDLNNFFDTEGYLNDGIGVDQGFSTGDLDLTGNDGTGFGNDDLNFGLHHNAGSHDPMGSNWNVGQTNDGNARVVETASSSEAPTPATDDEGGAEENQNPRKRRRRN